MKVTARELHKVLKRLPDPNTYRVPVVNIPVYPEHTNPQPMHEQKHMDFRIVTFTKRATKVGRATYVEWELDVG